MTGLRGSIVLMVAALVACTRLAAAPEPPRDAPAEPAPKLTEKPVKSLGKVGDAYGGVVISPNGERLAYVVYKEYEKWVVVCDGREGMLYRRLIGLRFSSDGKRLAYIGESPQGHVFVCEGAEKPSGGSLAFSPDGRHVAYQGPDGNVLRDGRPESEHSFLGKTLVFSPDSQHLAYLAGYPRRVICDGKSGPSYKEGVFGEPVFPPDGKSYAHTLSQGEKVGDKWVVYWKDKKVGGPYDMVEGIVFAPDSKRIAYRALVGGKWSVVVNDKKGPDFSQLGVIVFSGDNKRLAYPACDKDGWCVMYDGKKGLACAEVGNPVFSADSKHLAYRAVKDGKALVICDGMESAPFDEISWVGFTPNGNHIAFAAARGKDKFIVCDGVEGPPHERLMVPERPFEVASETRYVVIDKAETSLVGVDWPADRTWENAFKPSAK